MKNAENRKTKNKRTAIALACLPWGMMAWAYTYRQDKRRFFRSLTSVIFWLTITILVATVPETETIKSWSEERNIDRETTKNIMLIGASAVLAFVVVENWVKALRQTIKRSQQWYEKL